MNILTQEEQRRLDDCRTQKREVDRNCQRLMWAMIILSLLFYVMSMFATADSSSDPTIKGPAKWFYGVEAGAWQIIFATGTLIFGILGSMKKRIPTLLLAFFMTALLIRGLVGERVPLRGINIVLAAIGLGMTAILYVQIMRDGALQAEPGYPLFSVHTGESSEFQPSLVVTGRTASDRMEELKMPGDDAAAEIQAPVPEREPAVLPAGREVILPPEVQFGEISEHGVQQPQLSAQSRQQAAGIALDSLQAEQNAAQKTSETLLSPEGILEAMDEHPAASEDGDLSMLPDPDEVRRQLAAMKAAREQGQ